MEFIRVDYPQLEHLAAQFEAESERITGISRNLGTQIARLKRGGWLGENAHAFYRDVDADVIPAIERLHSALAQSAQVMRQIVEIMQTAEAEAATHLQGEAADNHYKTLALMKDDGSGRNPPDGTPEPQPPRPPDMPEPYAIPDVQQSELNALFSQYDDDPNIPAEILEKYTANPEMRAHQDYLIDAILDRALAGNAPLTAQELYDLALAQTGDSGTALILSHNVTKAMARGSAIIDFDAVERTDTYAVYQLNGQQYRFEFSDFPTDAVTTANGRPSIFYLVMSPGQLGTEDPGDFYHYFVTASATYYGATGRADFRNPLALYPGSVSFDLNPFDGDGVGIESFEADYVQATDMAVDLVMQEMRNSTPGIDVYYNTDPYRGWSWANALSYNEGSVYGGDFGGTQDEATRESGVHRQGALFGLELAGEQPGSTWRWFVPIIDSTNLPHEYGSQAEQAWAFINGSWHPQIGSDTYQIQDPFGNPIP